MYENQSEIPHSQKERQNHMIISIDSDKAFDKIEYPFIAKTNNNKKESSKLGTKENYLNLTKVTNEKIYLKILTFYANMKNTIETRNRHTYI